MVIRRILVAAAAVAAVIGGSVPSRANFQAFLIRGVMVDATISDASGSFARFFFYNGEFFASNSGSLDTTNSFCVLLRTEAGTDYGCGQLDIGSVDPMGLTARVEATIASDVFAGETIAAEAVFTFSEPPRPDVYLSFSPPSPNYNYVRSTTSSRHGMEGGGSVVSSTLGSVTGSGPGTSTMDAGTKIEFWR